MAQAKHPSDIDILALIAEVHGGSPEDLRQERITAALNTLEVTHRGAAQALRDVATSGLRRHAGAQQALPPQATPEAAVRAQETTSSASVKPTPENGVPTQVQSGEGAEVHMDHRTLTHIVRPNRGR